MLNRYVKPYFIPTTDEATERTPLLAPPPHTHPEPHLSPADLSEPSDPAAFIDLPDPASPPEPPTTESLHYDHTLLLTCLAIDGAAAFVLGANARGSQLLFVTFSVLSNLGAPSAAGAASLAVALGPAGMQPGQLFGALGVLEALTGGSVWPVLYTGVWVGSIGWYPPAMFLLAGLVWVAAAVMVAMIRLPRAGE